MKKSPYVTLARKELSVRRASLWPRKVLFGSPIENRGHGLPCVSGADVCAVHCAGVTMRVDGRDGTATHVHQ